jgi:predicted dehydrogenase
MAKKKITVGLIGSGWIGAGAQLDLLRLKPASHAEAITANKKLKLVAFLDKDPLAFEFAEKNYPNTPIYSDENEFFKHSFDIIVIATHPDSHCYYIDRSADHAVKFILCEKPISDDVEEAKKVIKKCNDKGILLLINHMRRFDSIIKDFKEYVLNEYVRDNSIGKIRGGFATYDNGLYHGGTHIIDLLRYYLGEVKAVNGVFNPIKKASEGDVVVDAILHFENCNITLNFISSDEYTVGEISLIGERGIIALKEVWGMEIEITGFKSYNLFSDHHIPDYRNTRKFGKTRSFMTGTYEHIIDCLENKATILCSGEDSLETLRVMKAIEQSALKEGKTILL